ncbi:DNA mismatch repair protein MutS [Brachyspira aalborgi]|jgi:DNA-nicking Smr family endonuclease|uniref:DNA mismatch repair protein MutS n=1 Tax=Brachyspira aalborgi TaxID=29522 RepID=A0AB38PYI2_9SPIR|nr:Smr/MutS family protein [Brachyspira aalborgi]MBS4762858.1 Smr/MutS family protein [Brachyspira sp.]CCY76227.1 smr domain protein [Brachyspira sp. CAG:700]TXJ14435.1 DNA mismatch repair protein MutS [Brachyspira aalborgi]TXJ19213.1 DNA mismatch repair protein MutS [Brachyspira aalborgi]TXJ25339.1 DNA mismatch repair protein MutS [Brachyspira aalborgi]
MSEDSHKNSKDKELFEFYLEHGYFPEDLNLNNKFQKKLKENSKNQKANQNKKNINLNKNNYDKDNNYSEKDKEIFLNAIKNLDCSNHIKNTNSIEKKYSKFKPNLKNVIPQDTLDLHGLTRERALHSVKKFIFEAKRNKLKVILIIHGKGFRSENKISVLKDLVEYYIATEGKYYIKYSTEAPARLGGGGAKLIYLHSND